MIDLFRTWLPQIIGYAESVEDGTIQKAWADRDLTKTSAYCSDELYEQIFGDLDSERMAAEAREALCDHPLVADGVEHFLSSLKRLDDWIEAHVDTDEWGKRQTVPIAVSRIFESQEWSAAQSAAATLVTAARQAGLSSNDFDPAR
jgi:hypothetical protein